MHPLQPSESTTGRENRCLYRVRLMTAAQHGDREAYRALLDDVAPEVERFVRARVPAPQDVDDVCQDVLVALHRARHTYQAPRPFEPWLFAIARHVIAHHLRQQRARRRIEVLGEPTADQAIPSVAHLRLRLTEALRILPRGDLQIITLLKGQGLSTELAATRLGTTPGALRVRAHRAYKRLRALLGT